MKIPCDISQPDVYIKHWKQCYKNDLVNDILPFWLKNGWDRENGGYYTCLDRDGSLIDTMKSVWFQGRFAYILALAYNRIEKKGEWLEASKSGIDFIEKHCFDSDGRMFFEVTATGVPVRKRRYTFSETFAAIAMAQYALASGDESYATKAVGLFNKVLYYNRTPGILTPKYRGGLNTKSLSLYMIMIDTAARIREAVDDPVLTNQINESLAEIRNNFVKPEFKALLETVGSEGEFIDSITGRTINPGHSIEAAWFILEEAKYRGWDSGLKQLGLTILDWSWKWGWDKKYKGISYFKDCRNNPPQEYWHDMKFWWPQSEAIIATLYAYRASGDPKYLEMHRMISDYTYSRFPDEEYGEWFGYFHYDGTLSQRAKGNMFKGPFHIPRMMIKCLQLCEELLTG
jgi:N-acylglucosamine 2-epimerase